MSVLDHGRAARAVALAAWAAFLGWLWAAGEVGRYLGPRTRWVAAVGIVVLGAAAAAHLTGLRRRSPLAPLGPREVAGIAVLLAPLAAVAVVPRPSLGALAAARKATGTDAIALSSLAAPAPEAGRAISFLEIHYANRSEDYAAGAGVDGASVRLLGFVSRSERAPGRGFELTRFYVSCCAADALPYSVAVLPPPGADADPPLDAWVEVAGRVVHAGSRYVVRATRVARRAEPQDPYLS